VDLARARARARSRFLHGAGGGRCGSSPVRDIGSNGNGTDISIIVSICTGRRHGVAPVRRSVRPSVRSL